MAHRGMKPLRMPSLRLLCVCWALAWATPTVIPHRLSATQARQLSITSFDVALEVALDGSLDVVESIRFRFDGSWNGVYRLVPVQYRTPTGFGHRLEMTVGRITDEDGAELRTEISRQGVYRKLKVWVPGARDTERTVQFRYHIANALRFFDEDSEGFPTGYDELYWNVTGDEWEFPIGHATALVELPEGVAGVRGQAYTGPMGSTRSDATVTELEDGFYFETTQTLPYRNGLTISVAWNPGVVQRPSAAERGLWFLRANWLFALPILSFLLMYHLWNTRGRDPERRVVRPEYKPPEGFTPAELGTLVDNRVNIHDITSSLVDLAIRGHIRIEEIDRTGILGWLAGDEYAFHAKTEPSAWTALAEHEQIILNGVFSDGEDKRVTLSDLQNEFYTHIPDIQSAIYRSLSGRGCYGKRPDSVLTTYVVAGVIVMGAGVFLGGFLAARWILPPVTSILAGILTGAPILGFGLFMPARTTAGTRKLEHILGFREFLNRVEADHFKRMIDSPEMFERYLPHAMALQVDKKWARAFDDLYTEPPDWYTNHSGQPFRPSLLSQNLSTMTASAGSAMASQPRSSGGSGAGGGGFSGGGGGGGGGGGF